MEEKNRDTPPLSRGLEIFQEVEQVGEVFLYRIALGFFGVRREGVGWGHSLEEAKASALEEAMALWELPEEAKAFLRGALLRAKGAKPGAVRLPPKRNPSGEGAKEAPPSAPASQGDFLEFPPEGENPSAEQAPPAEEDGSGEETGDAYSIVKKLLAYIRRTFGEEMIREIYAKADLPYSPAPDHLPETPEDIRLLYRTARRTVEERRTALKK